MNGRRERIGRFSDVASRQVVYQTAEGLEVDEVDHFTIARKRVYFDDVLLVTRHRTVGITFVVTMIVMAFIWLFLALVLRLTKEPEGALICIAIAVPFLLALVIRLVLKVDIITVYGRRSKAAMRFAFRKDYAHAKFDEICTLVARAQERVAAETPAAPAAPVAEEAYPQPPDEPISSSPPPEQ
jgi:hypothetical protein